MTGIPQVGEPAPDFTLQDVHGTPVTLSDLRGTPVLVVFFPFAFSGICTGEMCEIRDNLEDFEDAGVRVLAISCDPVYSLRAWSEQEGYDFDLLSDFWPHGEVARAYGVLDESRGLAIRGSFLVDEDGVIRWSIVNAPGEKRAFSGYHQALTLV